MTTTYANDIARANPVLWAAEDNCRKAGDTDACPTLAEVIRTGAALNALPDNSNWGSTPEHDAFVKADRAHQQHHLNLLAQNAGAVYPPGWDNDLRRSNCPDDHANDSLPKHQPSDYTQGYAIGQQDAAANLPHRKAYGIRNHQFALGYETGYADQLAG